MRPFKIGDKVRVKYVVIPSDERHMGRICTIKTTLSMGAIVSTDGLADRVMTNNQLELVKEDTQHNFLLNLLD